MIESIKDNEDRVVAYIEWSLRDKFGLEAKDGIFVWVNDLWVHKDYRHKKLIRMLSIKIYKRVPWVEHVYWKRHKYGGRKSQYEVKEILNG